MAKFGGEPPLEDVLSDPLVHAVMKGDGVDAGALRALLERISEARRSRCRGSAHPTSYCAAL